MRRLLVLILAVALIAVLSTSGHAQVRRPAPRGGGALFLAGTWQNIDAGPLNERLAAGGYPTFSDNFLGLGLGAYRTRGRLLLGLQGHGLRSTSGAMRTPDQELNLFAGYGLVDIGYTLTDGATILFPFAGIGGGATVLRIAQIGTATFDDVLAQPGRSVNLSESSFLLHLGLGADHVFGVGQQGRSLMLGLRAGYIFAPIVDEWNTADQHLQVSGGPEVGLSGPYLRIVFGRGRARR